MVLFNLLLIVLVAMTFTTVFSSDFSSSDFLTVVYDTKENEKLQVSYPPRVGVGEKFQVFVKIKGNARFYEYFVDGERVCDSLSQKARDRNYAHPHKHRLSSPFSHETPDDLPPASTNEFYVYDTPGVHTFGARALYCRDPGSILCGHGRLTSSLNWTVQVK